MMRPGVSKKNAGYGYGAGYGAGYGDGAGYGAGYGYGYGYGAGYGDGDGDGAGYGEGYGDSAGAYWRQAIPVYASAWALAQRTRLAELEREGAIIAYWCSDANGDPVNGGRKTERARVGLVQTERGPLTLCQPGTLHATMLPTKWVGTRRWIVALTGPVVGNEEKYGALTREILGEARGPES